MRTFLFLATFMPHLANAGVWLEIHCNEFEIMITPADKSIDFYQYMEESNAYYNNRSYQNHELYLKPDEWPTIDTLYGQGRSLIENNSNANEELDEGIAVIYNVNDESTGIYYEDSASSPKAIQQYCGNLVETVFDLIGKRFKTSNRK